MGLVRRALVVACVLACLAVAACAAQRSNGATASAHVKPARSPAVSKTIRSGKPDVLVWLPYWSMDSALASTQSGAGVITAASPFWYSIGSHEQELRESGAGDPAIVSELRASGEAVIPTVTEQPGLHGFIPILTSARRRAALVRTLVSIARQGNYSGLDLDFENFAVDAGHNARLADEAATAYPTLIAEACSALHRIHRSCELTVMPRTSVSQVYWRGFLATWVYDYGALAKSADRVQIMAYDEHAPGTAPGAVAPLSWVEQVISYASSVMAPARIELGLADYGYDFGRRGKATTLGANAALQLASQVRARPRWSTVQGEETFRYKVGRTVHTVWFENAAADRERAQLALKDGLAGVAIWAAGDEDPAMWGELRPLFKRG